ncbi:hypothetical protein A6F68_00894 [Tsuneonella dongtanensis]|uniref:Uncharacterized protein n=1 Tax=Tsuneonella dongtanensis TaxID=692370 RepID=A0A1B2AB76_9SPHN|nr:class I SAM-dependent methyltransferase [Tsuneonella dongtanensis]ANY19420.1 hypothetical protein A6F68_00894 [Tsuneonella dongtanensis]
MSERFETSGYEAKDDGYFGGVRRDFLALLPAGGDARVLEIGCGSGETGAAALADGLAASYHGVEIAPRAAALARTRLTEVIEGNVESLDLPWTERHFDAVLMSEVLEHLVDPWTVVERVAALLKPGALVVASSPNVAQIAIVRGLLAGRWDLTETGVMDRTHLRWFTRASYCRMFEDAGIHVDRIRDLSVPGARTKLFNLLTFGRLRHLTTRQICIVGRKR